MIEITCIQAVAVAAVYLSTEYSVRSAVLGLVLGYFEARPCLG